MKTFSPSLYLCYCLCLSLSFFLTSCSESETPKEEKIVKEEPKQYKSFKKFKSQKIIICGKIDEFKDAYTFRFESRFKNQVLDFDSLKFKIELESDLPIIVYFQNSFTFSFPIFAMPGDSINIDLNFSDVVNRKNSQAFTGSSVNENILLSRLNRKLVLERNLYYSQYNTDEANFLYKIDSLQKVGQELKESFTSIGSIANPYFEKYYDIYLNYKLASYLGNYPKVLKQFDPYKAANLSDDFFKKYNSYFIENSDYLNIPPYRSYITKHTFVLAEKIFNEENFDKKDRKTVDPAVSYYVIDSLFSNPEIIDHQKYITMLNEVALFAWHHRHSIRLQNQSLESLNRIDNKNFFGEGFGKYFESDFEIYKTMNPPKKYVETIEQKYQQILKEKEVHLSNK